ncbi:MAG: triose-phosphate isomerase [Candidatus Tectomicrobia bacterium]|nr:triose-phosphate isomerase [Candidatus Tectomicrobia bacterium]
MRRPLVAGNWKLHKTVAESVALAEELLHLLGEVREVDILVAPTFVALDAVARVLRGTRLAVAAQNLFWEPAGAYTGEVSAPLLTAVGCSAVILGHSERRQHFGDSEAQISRRVQAALASGLTPIVCVGETLAERRAGRTAAIIGQQLEGTLGALTPSELRSIVIAYEPVWAIGTGVSAGPAQAQEVHALIRAWVRARAPEVSAALRLLYGGSVKASNSAALLGEPDIDGALVGGASLDAREFAAIVRSGVPASCTQP